MSTLKRQALDAIIYSLGAEPQHWAWERASDPCVVRDRGSNIALWWWGGRAYIYRPGKVQFGFWGQRRLKRALRKWHKAVGLDQERKAETAVLEYVIATLAVQP